MRILVGYSKVVKFPPTKHGFFVCSSLINPRCQDSSGKHVVVVGLGRSGKSAALLALNQGTKVTAMDLRMDAPLFDNDPLFSAYAQQGMLTSKLGEHDATVLLQADLLVGVDMHVCHQMITSIIF